MVAVSGRGNSKPAAPYELSLAFSEVAATPDLVAIAADGNNYTGGAHAKPLLARFVWLPKEQRQLTTSILIQEPARLQELADYLREPIATALSVRIHGEELPPATRAPLPTHD